MGTVNRTDLRPSRLKEVSIRLLQSNTPTDSSLFPSVQTAVPPPQQLARLCFIPSLPDTHHLRPNHENPSSPMPTKALNTMEESLSKLSSVSTLLFEINCHRVKKFNVADDCF